MKFSTQVFKVPPTTYIDFMSFVLYGVIPEYKLIPLSMVPEFDLWNNFFVVVLNNVVEACSGIDLEWRIGWATKRTKNKTKLHSWNILFFKKNHKTIRVLSLTEGGGRLPKFGMDVLISL